jgi:hypothetical protein
VKKDFSDGRSVKTDFSASVKNVDARNLALIASELVGRGVQPASGEDTNVDAITNYVDAITTARRLFKYSSIVASQLKADDSAVLTLATIAARLYDKTQPRSESCAAAVGLALSLWDQCRVATEIDWQTLGKHIAETDERWAKQITLNKALMLITGKRSGPGGRKRFLEKYTQNGSAAEAQRFIQEHEGKPVSVQLVELYRKRFLSFKPKRARSAHGTFKKALRAEKKRLTTM